MCLVELTIIYHRATFLPFTFTVCGGVLPPSAKAVFFRLLLFLLLLVFLLSLFFFSSFLQ